MSRSVTGPQTGPAGQRPVPVDDVGLRATVTEVLDRRPSAGLAVAVVRDGRVAWFHGRGFADVAAATPITMGTVFRIGSITKTFTAIAVLQLWERGLVDLDSPANDYLRSIRLVPADPAYPPATVRHLLTHTAGIGYWLRFSDLLRPGVGSGVQARRRAPVLADYYRRGIPVEVMPGTKWTYSNHGFAVLGQLVEDVSAQPLDRYLRENVFRPLGMEHTDLRRSEHLRPDLATGYVLRSNGLRPVVERAVLAAGGGAAYSSTADMARYVTALLHQGSNRHGTVLEPATLKSMFQPHFQLDPRVPGMGLGFLLGAEDDHRTVGHDGIVSGFLSQMTLAPDDDIGVVLLANTGGLDGRGAPEPLGSALLRRLLDLPERAIRSDCPLRPEVWSDICGWYSPDPGPVTNLFTRAFMGAGAQVAVRRGRLMLEPLTPIPALRMGMRLYPDDAEDPYVFRVDFSRLGKGTLRVVFTGAEPGSAVPRLLMDGMSFRKRPDFANPRPWLTGALAVGAAGWVAHRLTRAAAASRTTT